ncbi:MAG: SDR family oxidoreductase [Pseudomonadota bacterium]|nr:SDR family oxidoreductase [Pseudomonadota bacterium]MEC9458762.1 SDR family oxidoreductase [Pseudomonadota bacterium]
MSLFNLKDKRALITGSTKGIGEAIARQFSNHGAKVVISSRKEDLCEKIKDEINSENPDSAISIPCNINYKEQLENLVNQTNEKFGGIDILVCNAAVNPFFGSSMDIPDDAFEKILSANIKSNHWLCNLVLPQMIERKDGVIIIISSVGGLKGSEMLGAYGISKAADMQLARNIAVEHGPNNIRANCISPGLVKTYFAKALWDNPDILKSTTSKAPLRRIGIPDEIAGAAVYLASQAGAFTTGQNIVIDGGVTIT